MQTYTHFVLTAVIARHARKRAENGTANTQLPPVQTKAALWGSVLPDMPLILLAGSFMVWDVVDGNNLQGGHEGGSHVGELFGDLFFNAWWVKLLHNLFHAPFLTILYTLIGYWAWKKGKAWGPALFSFGLATLLHTSLDIPLHYDDGPLLFFPFDWTTRFHSPISYWDPARHGREFSIFEHVSLLLMIIWLARERWRERRIAQK